VKSKKLTPSLLKLLSTLNVFQNIFFFLTFSYAVNLPLKSAHYINKPNFLKNKQPKWGSFCVDFRAISYRLTLILKLYDGLHYLYFPIWAFILRELKIHKSDREIISLLAGKYYGYYK
jgi:hypothetical protein